MPVRLLCSFLKYAEMKTTSKLRLPHECTDRLCQRMLGIIWREMLTCRPYMLMIFLQLYAVLEVRKSAHFCKRNGYFRPKFYFLISLRHILHKPRGHQSCEMRFETVFGILLLCSVVSSRTGWADYCSHVDCMRVLVSLEECATDWDLE